MMLDILSRKNQHHILLSNAISEKINLAFLESAALHLKNHKPPKALRNANFIFCDTKKITQQQFQAMHNDFQTTERVTILAINHYDPNTPLGKTIESLTKDTQWRIIITSSPNHLPDFIPISLANPDTSQFTALLKTHKEELEEFHQVTIPDEIVASAWTLANQYLPQDAIFEKTLELIDSAAARASIAASNDTKPIVTIQLLTQVLAAWTQIPEAHLQSNPFQNSKFFEFLQNRIVGQNQSLQIMTSALQHAYLGLQEKEGPLCSFLFAGPAETGKKTTAIAIAEYLFGNSSALLQINSDERFQSTGYANLLKTIQQTPYIVILIENIEQASAATFNVFKSILSQGYLHDEAGKKYDFRHAIIIMTTTLGSDKITSFLQPHTQDTKTLDLLQLVLNEPPEQQSIHHHLSFSELTEEIIHLLEGHFSSALLRSLHIVPFMPLDYSALEKIMRAKVKAIAKRLENQFGIELNYSPEIFKFLAHEALWRKPQACTLEKLLEEQLYKIIANEILAMTEDKNKPKRLLLRLNDSGQLLRCESLFTNERMLVQ